MSFCHKLLKFPLFILATRYSRPLIFQIMNYVRSSRLIAKHIRFTPLGYKDKGIRKFEFVAKTQLLCWVKMK